MVYLLVTNMYFYLRYNPFDKLRINYIYILFYKSHQPKSNDQMQMNQYLLVKPHIWSV